MVNIFDNNSISKIDISKTVQNGKDICDLYQPLVEKRLKQLMKTQMNSGSIICFTGDPKSGNSIESKLLEKISWNDDQIGNYMKNIYRIMKKNKLIGEFLKWKCFYNMTDKEISEKMKIAERTIRKYKARAYYQLAVFSNQVEFVYEITVHFKLK